MRRGQDLVLQLAERPELPTLAWCAHLPPGRPEVRVVHGAGVEVREDAFVEGAWAGDFDAFDFLAAPVFCGSGGALRDGRLRLSGGSDRQAPIFSIAGPRGLHVSNSPVFAMAAAGESPDPIYPFYAYDVLACWRAGLHGPSRALPLASGRRLRIHVLGGLEVGPGSRLAGFVAPAEPVPTDFPGYRSLLSDAARDVFANARAPGRSGSRYEPLVALSRGYDTTAVAALASAEGCREAVTFLDPQRGDPHEDDGSENARRLGMGCTAYDRFAYLAGDGAAEREAGWLPHSTPLAWAALGEQLRGRLLVNGTSGEFVWDPRYSRYSSALANPDARLPAMLAQTELRLRVGYASMALANVGARHAPAIHRIGTSETMRPWSVGGDYDRPLPRRLAEEAGLPRESFGQRKMASARVHLNGRRHFSEKGWADYRGFVGRAHAEVPWARRRAWRLAVEARQAAWRRLGSHRPRASSPLVRRLPFLLGARPKKLPWSCMFTLPWVFDATRHRYRVTGPGVSDAS